MKYIFKVALLFIFFSKTAYAQQNLFNIPSGDITHHKKIFYQHQFNLYSDKLESKAHFVYGFGKGWDGGINLVGKGLYFSPEWRALYNDNTSKGALYPILMGTIQKQFKLSEYLDVNLGSQIGYNLSKKVMRKKLNYFAYGMGIYHFMKGKSRIVGGLYQSNQMYVGIGNTFGAMLGYEIKLSKRWYLMGDWVSGNNDAAVAVIGGMLNASKRIQVCAGWQIPNPKTSKPMGLVLELNILSWDLFESTTKSEN